MTNNIFVENISGHVSHTNLSLQLAVPTIQIRGMIVHQTELVLPTVSKLVEAHEQYGTENDSETHTLSQIAFDTDKPALDWFADDHLSSARFAEGMKFAASSGPFSTQHIVKSFDWERPGERLVVEVSIKSKL
jgi:hypothetical protein